MGGPQINAALSEAAARQFEQINAACALYLDLGTYVRLVDFGAGLRVAAI